MKDACFIIRAIPREKSALVCLCSKLSHVWKSQKVENVTSVGKKKASKIGPFRCLYRTMWKNTDTRNGYFNF